MKEVRYLVYNGPLMDEIVSIENIEGKELLKLKSVEGKITFKPLEYVEHLIGVGCWKIIPANKLNRKKRIRL